MQDLKILALQSNIIWEAPSNNRIAFTKMIEREFDGHDIIILPETFTTGFPVDPQYHAEKYDGETIHWMKEISEKYNTSITGSLLLANNETYTNTLVWIHNDGEISYYNKRHVFSMGGEHNKIKAGDTKLIVELKGWNLRPMICYDLRFPVWSMNTYNNGFEYDIAIYVANWPAIRSYPWKTLLLARAIENQAYVIGLNRIGEDGPGNHYSGDSMIIDPKGEILDQGEPGKELAISAILSFNDLQDFRQKFNVGPDWDRFKIED